jgi:hypothetical protein
MFGLFGPLLALLPQRWRRTLVGDVPINWRRAALVSGILEAVILFGLLLSWFIYYLPVAKAEQERAVLEALMKSQVVNIDTSTLRVGMGLSTITAFWIHPLTWVLMFFCLEGVLRALAAALTQEVVGTTPLALADRVLALVQRRSYEWKVPLVADEVTRGDEKTGWDLKVESCRPKPTWKYPLTIQLGDEFFRVEGAVSGATTARPHAYLLRRPPEGEAYRGVELYDPRAILQSEPASQNFLVQPIRAKAEEWRLSRLPLVPDFVFNGDGKEGWHLRVISCRAKPEWRIGRTIRYEGKHYRILDTCEGTPERPFGFRLRLLFDAEAVRGPLDYTPDEPLRTYGN